MSVAAASATQRAPRVLVVGMFDRQFQLVADEYPSLQFDHYKDGSYSEIDGAVKRADHICVITKFISHAVWDHVKKSDSRLAYFSGLEGLRRICAGIVAGAAFRQSPKVVPLRDKSAPYCDYSPLMHAAKAGTVLTFQRPEGVPAHLFAQDVHSAREVAVLRGIRSECTITGGRAEVTVTSVATQIIVPEVKREAFRVPTLAEEARMFWRDVYCESFRAMPYLPSSTHAASANAAADAFLSLFNPDSP